MTPMAEMPATGPDEPSASDRTRHRRLREKGRTDRAALYEVLNPGFVCHLGVLTGGVPMVVPTVYGFDTDAATTILAISLAETSVKISSGPPDDGDGPDAALGLWAGAFPLATT